MLIKEQRKAMKFLNVIIVMAITASANSVSAAPPKTSPTSAVKTPTLKAEASDAANLSGKVVETMNASGYTYVCLEKKGVKTWVAVPETKVKLGSEMSFLPGQTMTNFTSKTLNRTFDSIVFSSGPASGGNATQGHPALPSAAAGSKAQVATKDKDIKVEKASGPNGRTVAEVYSRIASLNKKTVSVRGKVVKVSAGIMGRNWLHIQDGTGDQQKGTHDLVATSQELPAVGDVVTVTGTLAKDRDFGAGYRYKAIIEDAKIQK